MGILSAEMLTSCFDELVACVVMYSGSSVFVSRCCAVYLMQTQELDLLTTVSSQHSQLIRCSSITL